MRSGRVGVYSYGPFGKGISFECDNVIVDMEICGSNMLTSSSSHLVVQT